MRPSETTDGNGAGSDLRPERLHLASMRPSETTDGNPWAHYGQQQTPMGFNEAVGNYRRKRHPFQLRYHLVGLASMRPSETTDGNHQRGWRRQRPGPVASMRPSETTDGNEGLLESQELLHLLASMRPSETTDGNGPSPTLHDADKYTPTCER